MQLSIIIVNYNVKYFLEQCLCSLYKAIQTLEAEVWVVDNASTDGSVAYLKARFPGTNFIVNQQNLGFAKANNKALVKCKGKYVLFLNPDTLIPEDCLVKCLPILELETKMGALGIRMVDGNGTFLRESKRSLPSPISSLFKLIGLNDLFPSSKTFSKYSLGWLDQYGNYEVDVLAGAFMLVRRKLLLKLKGFDENFFMYGEDIDLSYRIQKSGYQNYYFGGSTIIHFKGKSTKTGSLNYVKIFYEAMSVFVRKHYASNSARLFALIIHPAIWVRAGISAIGSIAVKTKLAFAANGIFENERRIKDAAIVSGSEEDFDEVKTLLVNTGIEEVLVGPQNLKEINAIITQKKLKEVIFCEGCLSFKEIIEAVQLIEPKISIRFHARGTQSIVGTNAKDMPSNYDSLKSSAKVVAESV